MEIAIFGAGVGGLTAAHKLATTDIPFQITIYEQKPVAGGLVRSEGPPCRTREVSWRVYFDFYHYLPSIMRQIPDGKGKTVYDHLIPYKNKTLPSKMRIKDLALCAAHIASIVTASDERLNQWDSDTWYDSVGKHTRLDIPQWLGLDRYRASYMSVAKVGIELFILGGSSGKNSVLDGPTNEVWIDPWVDYLKSLGVEFRFNSPVESIDTTGPRPEGYLKTGEKITADIFILSVPAEVLANLLPTPKNIRLASNTYQIQLAFQLYLTTPLSFGVGDDGRPILSVLLKESPWALIIEDKAVSWSILCAPWSVSVCQADVPGPLTGKPLTRCTEAEAFREIMFQMSHNNKFIKLLKKENPNFSEISIDKWATMDDTFIFSETGMVTTDPKFSNNAKTKTLRPSFFIRSDLYVSTAYVKETLDVFSMEAAAIAGHFVAAKIIGSEPPILPERPLRELFSPIRRADSVLARRGAPHIGFVCVWVLIIILIIWLYSLIKKKRGSSTK